MPRKKMRRTKNQKRKISLDDDENISHSESSTNKNNQSDSWECPVSVKKNLIPNPTTTFNRRGTLRSSTRLNKTGTSSLRRSSRRHSSAPVDIQQHDDTSKSNTINSAHQVSEGLECPVSAKKNLIPNSRTTFNRHRTLRSSTRLSETGTASRRRTLKRHTSAPDEIQQLDDTSNTMNSAHQVSEGSDQVEIQSPSRYLVSVAYPHTIEPEFGHKEAENVENSTLAEPNMMEEVGEAEPNKMEEVGEADEPNNMMDEVGEADEPNNMIEEVGESEPNTMEEAVEAEPNTIQEEGDGEAEKPFSIHAGKKTFELGEAGISLSNHSNELAGQNTFVTVEPHLGHNEAEIVGNSTIGIPEKVGQLGESEMPLADHTNQRDGKNTCEAQEIQASNKFEKIINKNHRKSISRAGCTFPSFSLKLTEVVGMVQNEDGVDSEIQSQPEDTVNGYQVKPEFMPILRNIINKHGDIAKNCLAKSVKYRSKLLELICEIISEFEMKNISKIKESVLKSKIDLVDEIKNMKVEVEWLRRRLAEVDDARDILKQFAMLKEKTDNNRKLIEDANSELLECEEQKKELLEKLDAIRDKETACKQRLAIATDDSTKISRTVRFAKSKVGRFLNSSVMDGLI
ncbi:unnamed protein product [Trifolium pratense]|uniref:Uncharacterized protein n=1 Tax=Trifolium pratense TaxID=57577 RepID=A0ACB0M9U8_TRIPR|nr:unnamed protein product [Trifolium pratense]